MATRSSSGQKLFDDKQLLERYEKTRKLFRELGVLGKYDFDY